MGSFELGTGIGQAIGVRAAGDEAVLSGDEER